MINLIGDADLCADALGRAERIAALSHAPLLNPPALVAATGRLDNARRLGALPGVETPRMRHFSRQDFCQIDNEAFPLLLRAEGFHAGRHFHRVERREDSRRGARDVCPATKLSPCRRSMRGAPTGCIANSGRWRSAKGGFRCILPSARIGRSIISAPTWATARSPARRSGVSSTTCPAPSAPRLGGARSDRRNGRPRLFWRRLCAGSRWKRARVRSQRGDGDVRPSARADMGLPPPRPCRRARRCEGDGLARRARLEPPQRRRS